MDKTEFENYFTGKCTDEQRMAAEQWINANIETEEFARLSREMLENMPFSDPSETRRAYRQLNRRIASICGASILPRWRKRLRQAAGIAAVAALGFGCAIFITFDKWKNEPEPQLLTELVQQYCRRGASRNILLPDSTIVTLFGDSRIVYDRNTFDDMRQVWLFGDAFFDVAKQGGSSFDVKCINTDVRVFSTSFEVLSHDADDNFEVSLYSGSVRVTPCYNGHSDTLRLHPGDVVRIDKQSGTITRHTVPWLGKDSTDVVYIGSKVSDILSRLERRYNKTIVLQGHTQEVADTRLNLIYHPTDSLETILSAICEFSDLHITEQNEEIILSQKP